MAKKPRSELSMKSGGTRRADPAIVVHYDIAFADNLDKAKFVSNWDTTQTHSSFVQNASEPSVVRGHVKLIKPSTPQANGIIKVVVWFDANSTGLPKVSAFSRRRAHDLSTGMLTITLTNDPNYNEPSDLFDPLAPVPPPPVEAPPAIGTTTTLDAITVAIVP
jgi:hypothetical protein